MAFGRRWHFNSGARRRNNRNIRNLMNRRGVSPYYTGAKVRSMAHVIDHSYTPKESIFSDSTSL